MASIFVVRLAKKVCLFPTSALSWIHSLIGNQSGQLEANVGAKKLERKLDSTLHVQRSVIRPLEVGSSNGFIKFLFVSDPNI